MPHILPSIVGKPPSVVIVDDQTAGRKILERLIRGIDPRIEVATFDEASSALKFIQTTVPDLIVTAAARGSGHLAPKISAALLST